MPGSLSWGEKNPLTGLRNQQKKKQYLKKRTGRPPVAFAEHLLRLSQRLDIRQCSVGLRTWKSQEGFLAEVLRPHGRACCFLGHVLHVGWTWVLLWFGPGCSWVSYVWQRAWCSVSIAKKKNQETSLQRTLREQHNCQMVCRLPQFCLK